MKSGIYQILNKVNKKYYIGSAVDLSNRWATHKYKLNLNKHSSPLLQNVWNKYGEDAFQFIVLEYVPNVEWLIEIEQYWIDFMESANKEYGYNICPTAGLGGRLGIKHTEETKQKFKNRKHSKETKIKIGLTSKGRKISDITKQKLTFKGHKHTEHSKQQISYRRNHKRRLIEEQLKLTPNLSNKEIATIIGCNRRLVADTKVDRYSKRNTKYSRRNTIMAYATPTDLTTYCDERIIADLCADNGYRPTPTQLLTNTNVLASLSASSGQINTAILTANRYTIAELQALTGDDQAVLTMLNCWLAFGILCSRRGRNPKDEPFYLQALEMVDQLKQGHRIFNVPGNVAAGTPNQLFLSYYQWQTVNSVRSATYRLFPTRRVQNVTGSPGMYPNQ